MKLLQYFVILFAVFALCVMGIAYAAPTIERKIDGKIVMLNVTPCEVGFKGYVVENDIVKAGCWHNDGKYVIMNIDGVITKYDKTEFEL